MLKVQYCGESRWKGIRFHMLYIWNKKTYESEILEGSYVICIIQFSTVNFQYQSLQMPAFNPNHMLLDISPM